jgi:hypothetical protein
MSKQASAASTPEEVIRAAISAANVLQSGVEFPPFLIKAFPFGSIFTGFWTSKKGGDLAGPVTFYQFTGSTGPFLPLGDYMCCAPDEQPLVLPDGVLLFAPAQTDPACLAHPLDFEWILDDHGSGNPDDITYWRMLPPPGYTSVGNAFATNKPDPNNYWCVKNDYLVAAGRKNFWSDEDQRWSHNGNTNIAVLPNGPPPDGQMWIAPPAFVSDEGGDAAWGLLASMAFLTIQPFDAPEPVYDAEVTSGQQTDRGLNKVAIVPYTAVPADAAFPQQALTSTFYFIGCEPLWNCDATLNTPAGGYYGVTKTVGVTTTESVTFSAETSFTIDCNVGLQFEELSLGASGSLTQSFTLTTEASTTGNTESQTTVNVNFPNAQLVAIWSLLKQVQVFRSDGSLMAAVNYYTPNQRMICSPTDSRPIEGSASEAVPA